MGGGQLPFKIESGIPLATVHQKRKNPYSDLFASMKPPTGNKPGDSFLIANEHKFGHVYYHAGKWGKENNAAFAFRNTEAGKRCWRIK